MLLDLKTFTEKLQEELKTWQMCLRVTVFDLCKKNLTVMRP